MTVAFIGAEHRTGLIFVHQLPKILVYTRPSMKLVKPDSVTYKAFNRYPTAALILMLLPKEF